MFPSILSTFVHNFDSVALLSKLYNHKSVELIFSLSTLTVVLGVLFVILKSLDCKFPCLKWTKNPVLLLPEPCPLSLYIKLNLFPGKGSSSVIVVSLNEVLTISNWRDMLSIDLVNPYTGTPFPIELNLYLIFLTD